MMRIQIDHLLCIASLAVALSTLQHVRAHEKATNYINDEVLSHILSGRSNNPRKQHVNNNDNDNQRDLIGMGIFNSNNDNDDNDNNNGSLGDRCGTVGGLYTRRQTTCAKGLECEHVGFGKRCIPPQECLQQGLQEFEMNFDATAYKQHIFQQANITQHDIFQGRQLYPDDREWVRSDAMQALIKAMQEHPPDQFQQLGTVFEQCSSAYQTHHEFPTSSSEPNEPEKEQNALDKDSKTTHKNPPPTRARQLFLDFHQNSWFAPASESPSMMPTTEEFMQDFGFATEAAQTGTPSDAPSMVPTTAAVAMAESESESEPTPETESRQTFLGIHIEGGTGLDGSLSVFWKDGDTNTTYIRGCLGTEIGAGAELSFIALFSTSGITSDITCGSILFDVDAGIVAVSAGVGLGVCYNVNPGMVYWEVTAGVGVGFGAGVSGCGVITA